MLPIYSYPLFFLSMLFLPSPPFPDCLYAFVWSVYSYSIPNFGRLVEESRVDDHSDYDDHQLFFNTTPTKPKESGFPFGSEFLLFLLLLFLHECIFFLLWAHFLSLFPLLSIFLPTSSLFFVSLLIFLYAFKRVLQFLFLKISLHRKCVHRRVVFLAPVPFLTAPQVLRLLWRILSTHTTHTHTHKYTHVFNSHVVLFTEEVCNISLYLFFYIWPFLCFNLWRASVNGFMAAAFFFSFNIIMLWVLVNV